MRDLNYQLKMLCKHSHEGSFETRVVSVVTIIDVVFFTLFDGLLDRATA